MNNTYYILRHGETPYQAEEKNIVYPWPEDTPILLTEKGEKEVKKTAQQLKDKKIDLIYSSDANRTRRTAEIVNQELGVEIIFDPRLRDIDAGIYKGDSLDKYKEFVSSLEDKLSKRPPQGESWNDLRERMIGFLKDVDKRYRDKTILIVSHKGPLWMLEISVRGLKNEELLELKEKGLGTGQFRKLEIINAP